MKTLLRNFKDELFMLMALILGLAAIMAMVTACGKVATAGRAPGAERVFVAEPGYVCFLIRDDEGKGIGGNCVKE